MACREPSSWVRFKQHKHHGLSSYTQRGPVLPFRLRPTHLTGYFRSPTFFSFRLLKSSNQCKQARWISICFLYSFSFHFTLSRWKTTMTDYYNTMNALAERVTFLLAKSVGADPSCFSGGFSESLSVLRLIHYSSEVS